MERFLRLESTKAPFKNPHNKLLRITDQRVYLIMLRVFYDYSAYCSARGHRRHNRRCKDVREDVLVYSDLSIFV
jgi:hypothetical protein